ncbi:VirB4 family type IV secretion/conjugal transfer ATPase [Hyphomicrobium sp. 2TAF46]|uniref:VirB4 family type IV secretion/conjugal transfer ATPase n=1 Tax=Hyphomicrobium sp. 2TAF46 TaxID=3233019 RepID=UPI003F920DFF
MADRATLMTRELESQEFIPYGRHVDAHTITVGTQGLMTMVEIEGFAFETADNRDLNGLQARLNTLWRNITDPRLALYALLIRRQAHRYPEGKSASPFAAALDAKYQTRLANDTLYDNRHVLALVWMPGTVVEVKAAALFATLRRTRETDSEPDPKALKALADATRLVLAELAPLGARQLGLFEHNGILASEISTVLHHLLGGRLSQVPLTRGAIRHAIHTDRIIIGRETLELRDPGATRYAGMLGIKEYPARTSPGMLNELLALPFELTAVQSFRCIDKASARAILSRKQNQMLNAADKAFSQVEELSVALDDLESNRWVLGEHHLSVAVFAEAVTTLNDHLAAARSAAAAGGAVIVREDLGLEAAWWAQLPGNFRFRKRSGAITSANFASLAPLHGFPKGRADGNSWGPAVAMFKTQSGAPYFFNFHDGDLGNTFICGPSGSGKTVVLNFLLSQVTKHGARIVLFDKDRGADLFVRALGGSYLPLKSGVPTGFAPLKAMPYDAAGQSFLTRWLESLAGGTLSASDRQALTSAVAALGESPVHTRSFGALRSYLDQTETDGLAARLKRWQRGDALGWVFDNPDDVLDAGVTYSGYDMTEFIDNPDIRGPLMAYVFERIERTITGERIVIAIDEFWKALGDPMFSDLANNKLKTIRKQNGLMVFATQSPADALRSKIAHTIIEQCPTQIFMANGRASASDYVTGMKLTAREFELIARELTPESRRFLIKQGHASVVAELDLSGFDDELAILSGRTANVRLADDIRDELRSDPSASDGENWIVEFQKRRSA